MYNRLTVKWTHFMWLLTNVCAWGPPYSEVLEYFCCLRKSWAASSITSPASSPLSLPLGIHRRPEAAPDRLADTEDSIHHFQHFPETESDSTHCCVCSSPRPYVWRWCVWLHFSVVFLYCWVTIHMHALALPTFVHLSAGGGHLGCHISYKYSISFILLPFHVVNPTRVSFYVSFHFISAWNIFHPAIWKLLIHIFNLLIKVSSSFLFNYLKCMLLWCEVKIQFFFPPDLTNYCIAIY